MGKEIKIICDNCKADITYTESTPSFRLHLAAERLRHTSNTIYALHVEPPLKHDCCFCGLNCLKEWAGKN